MTVRRLLDVLTEEERELQARVTALRAEIEGLKKKSATLKARTKKQQIALNKVKADVSKAKDEIAELTKQALGIKDGHIDKNIIDWIESTRNQGRKTQKQTFPTFPPKDSIRWSLDNPYPFSGESGEYTLTTQSDIESPRPQTRRRGGKDAPF